MKNDEPKDFTLNLSNPDEIQIRYLMKMTGTSRKEIEDMLQLYGVPTHSIINYMKDLYNNGLLK